MGMKMSLFVMATACAVIVAAANAVAKDKMEKGGHTHHGLIAIKTSNGRFLQAYTNGEVHGSNNSCNSEETWVLVEISKKEHLVALRNYRTGNYLRPVNDYVRADNKDAYNWTLKKLGKDRYTFQAADGTYLRSNKPGDNHGGAGGEVWRSADAPAEASWTIEPARTPSNGSDVDWADIINAVDDAIQFIVSMF